MISPFEVYLVMQLDNVGACLTLIACLWLGYVGLHVFVHSMNRTSYDEKYEPEKYKAAGIYLKDIPRKMAIPLVIVFLTSFIPSSKTAAAMIILPALTSKEVTEPLAAEGKELYALAKQALRDAVDAKDTKTEPKK